MIKKLCYAFAVALLLTAVSETGFSQEKTATEEHHTGVKRTYNKAKHKVKHAWTKTKATTAKEYNKAKTRVTTDDTKRDQQEKSK